MIVNIRNGVRVPVSFPAKNRPGYEGPAAIEETETGGSVYFAGRPFDVKGIVSGVVGGRPVTVDAITASGRADGFVVIAFRWA